MVVPLPTVISTELTNTLTLLDGILNIDVFVAKYIPVVPEFANISILLLLKSKSSILSLISSKVSCTLVDIILSVNVGTYETSDALVAIEPVEVDTDFIGIILDCVGSDKSVALPFTITHAIGTVIPNNSSGWGIPNNNVCGRRYRNWTGSAPCCGSLVFVVDIKIKEN